MEIVQLLGDLFDLDAEAELLRIQINQEDIDVLVHVFDFVED